MREDDVAICLVWLALVPSYLAKFEMLLSSTASLCLFRLGAFTDFWAVAVIVMASICAAFYCNLGWILGKW